jgi:hypothetical protein
VNLGVINGHNSTWKRIGIQNIALTVAAALATSALVTGVSIQEQGATRSTSAPETVRSIPSFDVAGKSWQVLVYIVGSEAEAWELQSSLASAVSESEATTLREVIVVESSEDKVELQIRQVELLSALNTDTTLLDLRR